MHLPFGGLSIFALTSRLNLYGFGLPLVINGLASGSVVPGSGPLLIGVKVLNAAWLYFWLTELQDQRASHFAREA